MEKYTYKQFQAEFSNDDICLDYIFALKHPEAKQYYRVKGRKCYANPQGKQLHPLVGTIFEKSSTSLTNWLYAIFLFSASRNGVSAKELQRQLGVTYKCAWRMANSIRKLMESGDDMLSGTVEVDETYFGGRTKGHAEKFSKKTALMGMVERKGRIRVKKISDRGTRSLLDNIKATVSKDAIIMSDEFRVYAKLPKLGYESHRIKHGKRHWVRGDIHTNTIEGFWGQLKRSIRGTYHSVSPRHLQSYANEFAFRYSHRHASLNLFHLLMERV
ncbi:MAG: IS1595 family transposase [Patescibacteria group bacterium]|mgnify:CR=1 FL=1